LGRNIYQNVIRNLLSCLSQLILVYIFYSMCSLPVKIKTRQDAFESDGIDGIGTSLDGSDDEESGEESNDSRFEPKLFVVQGPHY